MDEGTKGRRDQWTKGPIIGNTLFLEMLVCSLPMATEGGQSDRAVEAAAFSVIVEAVTFSVAVGMKEK